LFENGITSQTSLDISGYDIFGFSHFDYGIESSSDHLENDDSGQGEHSSDGSDRHDAYDNDLQEGIEMNDLSDVGGYSSGVAANERDGQSGNFNNLDHRSPGNTST
jgi:hypothetical protein